ncbi:hypothetical protein HZC35_04880 [Candidatus Saganbacteria bacterium]|nr:hypothetical protein [Candidatus Saganbacteria bacterium]
MKRSILVLVLILVLGGTCLAQYGRYQVFSEKRYFWGPKIIIMLDSDTGKTWEYADSKWKLLKREGEEKISSEEELDRQQELLKALEMEKQKQIEPAKTPPKPLAPRVMRKKKVKPVEVEGEGEGEDAPGWIKE